MFSIPVFFVYFWTVKSASIFEPASGLSKLSKCMIPMFTVFIIGWIKHRNENKIKTVTFFFFSLSIFWKCTTPRLQPHQVDKSSITAFAPAKKSRKCKISCKNLLWCYISGPDKPNKDSKSWKKVENVKKEDRFLIRCFKLTCTYLWISIDLAFHQIWMIAFPILFWNDGPLVLFLIFGFQFFFVYIQKRVAISVW